MFDNAHRDRSGMKRSVERYQPRSERSNGSETRRENRFTNRESERAFPLSGPSSLRLTRSDVRDVSASQNERNFTTKLLLAKGRARSDTLATNKRNGPRTKHAASTQSKAARLLALHAGGESGPRGARPFRTEQRFENES